MNPFDESTNELLEAARTRGTQTLSGIPLAPGLDQFTVYAGLIGSALELGKLISTEQRDLTVIHHHYEISVANINAAFAEVEQAMFADFERDETMKAKTFDAINQLIQAGQFELASEFHRRLFDGPKRAALDSVLDARNSIAQASGSRLFLK